VDSGVGGASRYKQANRKTNPFLLCAQQQEQQQSLEEAQRTKETQIIKKHQWPTQIKNRKGPIYKTNKRKSKTSFQVFPQQCKAQGKQAAHLRPPLFFMSPNEASQRIESFTVSSMNLYCDDVGWSRSGSSVQLW